MTGPTVPSLDRLRERRSVKWRLYPPDVLPLPVAEMDFELAEPVKAALHAAVERSDTGYAMAEPDLGAAFAGFAERRWQWRLDPRLVRAVPDVAVGVIEVLRVLVRPGDAVVVSPPVYPPFFGWLAQVGARAVEVPLAGGPDGGWRLDLPAIEAAFARGAAAYLLCSPHNPVGRVHTADELAALTAAARRHGVTIVSDEIHAPLTLPGATFTPILTVPGAAQVAISVVSASKAWNLAGLKCAAIVADGPGAELLDRLPEDVSWHTGHFGVLASVAALTEGEPWLDAVLRALADRRDQVGRAVAGRLPGVRWHPPEATYLAWLDCTALGPGTIPCTRFVDEARVALEPGPHFGTPGSGYVRLNFATSEPILDQALSAMAVVLG